MRCLPGVLLICFSQCVRLCLQRSAVHRTLLAEQVTSTNSNRTETTKSGAVDANIQWSNLTLNTQREVTGKRHIDHAVVPVRARNCPTFSRDPAAEIHGRLKRFNQRQAECFQIRTRGFGRAIGPIDFILQELSNPLLNR